MKKSGKWLIAAAAFIAVGTLLLVFAFGMSRRNDSVFDAVKYEARTVTIEEDFRGIMIRTHTEDISLLPSNDGKCKVVFYEPEKAEFGAAVSDGTLSVESEPDNGKWYEHFSFFSSAGQRKITVYLPGKDYAKLSVQGSTGDIRIPMGFSFESIEIGVSTGDVDCAAACSGTVFVKASTGDIRLSQLNAAQIDLSVSTGAVKLDSVSCTGSLGISVSTGKTALTNVSCGTFMSEGSTGDVSLTNVTADKLLSVTRSTGDVKLHRCDAASLDLHTTTGSVSGTLLAPKYFVTHTSTGHVSVPENGSAEAKCTVSTTTGDIRIEIAE